MGTYSIPTVKIATCEVLNARLWLAYNGVSIQTEIDCSLGVIETAIKTFKENNVNITAYLETDTVTSKSLFLVGYNF